MKSKRFELEVATAEMATNVLTTLELLEISNVRVTKLDHTRMKDIENEARVKCITIARRKAEALVRPLEQKIGKAIHIAESPQADAQPSTMGSALSEVVVTGYSTIHGNKSNIPEINFRKLTVNKIVYVNFRCNSIWKLRTMRHATGVICPRCSREEKTCQRKVLPVYSQCD